MDVKVKLLRPLDGKEIGATAEYPKDDAKRLADNGVVQIVAEKAAPEPKNKMAPAAENKAAISADDSRDVTAVRRPRAKKGA